MTHAAARAIVVAERRVLSALLSRMLGPTEWIEIDRKLAAYSWQEADHAVLYEAIVRGRSRSPGHWREQLLSETTRMGFPDLDWELFLRPSPVGPSEPGLDELIHDLELATGRSG
jgi:hypothetical protein